MRVHIHKPTLNGCSPKPGFRKRNCGSYVSNAIQAAIATQSIDYVKAVLAGAPAGPTPEQQAIAQQQAIQQQQAIEAQQAQQAAAAAAAQQQPVQPEPQPEPPVDGGAQ